VYPKKSGEKSASDVEGNDEPIKAEKDLHYQSFKGTSRPLHDLAQHLPVSYRRKSRECDIG